MTEIVYVRITEHDEETDVNNDLYFAVDSPNYLDEIPCKIPFTTIRDEIYYYIQSYLPRAGKGIALTANIEATVTFDIAFDVAQDYVLMVETYSDTYGSVGYEITEENPATFKITAVADCTLKYHAIPIITAPS